MPAISAICCCIPIRMFRANPDVLKEYHAKFRYILVDEYQDTKHGAIYWLELLAQRTQGFREEQPLPKPCGAAV